MSLLNEASFLVTPNGYKASKLYAAIPTNGNGDMTFTRATTATRLDENDLISSVASNVPRIDYTGGGCPSILLEPLRTNLLTYSEQFDNAAWSASLAATITPNATTAPDGTMTADSITTTPGALSYFSQSTTQPAGTYTLSFFVKPQLGIGRIHLEIFTSNPGTHYFNLDLGVVTGSGDSTFTITPYPNGWYRCTATRTFASSISGTGAIYLATYGISATLTTIFFWGAQLEEGAYATSYIPTTTIALARNADVINRDDIYTNNLITDAGGTWFVDLINNVLVLRDTSDVGLFIGNSSSGATGDVLAIRNNSTNRLSINKRIASSQTSLHVTTTDHVKVAIKWGGGKAKVFVNGALIAISSGVYETDFNTTDMEFFRWTGADVSKYIKQMALFPTPLSDDQCIALTTL
jgi:hypothetical protein